jgi:hypothetical protein
MNAVAPKPREEGTPISTAQLEITKAAIEASARITASMVTVTNEKNPAKISEAYRVIYKTVIDAVKGAQKKPGA